MDPWRCGQGELDPEGPHGDALREWVDAAARYARGLPPKPVTSAGRKRR